MADPRAWHGAPAMVGVLGSLNCTPCPICASCPGPSSRVLRRGRRSAGHSRVRGQRCSPSHVACRDGRACRGASVRAAQPDPLRRSCLCSPAGPPTAATPAGRQRKHRLWQPRHSPPSALGSDFLKCFTSPLIYSLVSSTGPTLETPQFYSTASGRANGLSFISRSSFRPLT